MALRRTLKPGQAVALSFRGEPVGVLILDKSSGNRAELVLKLSPETLATHEATPAPQELPPRARRPGL